MSDIDIGVFGSIDYIAWLVAGLILCAAETVMPGAFLIWIGAAALILGGVEFFFPLYFTEQLLLFSGLVVVLVLAGRWVYGSVGRGSPPLALNRAEELVGKEFFLDQPIERGFGSIRVDDSVWRVTGEDGGAGEKVRVTAVEQGSLLRVAKV